MRECLIVAFSCALQFPGCYILISSHICQTNKPQEHSIVSPTTITVLPMLSQLKTDSFRKSTFLQKQSFGLVKIKQQKKQFN